MPSSYNKAQHNRYDNSENMDIRQQSYYGEHVQGERIVNNLIDEGSHLVGVVGSFVLSILGLLFWVFFVYSVVRIFLLERSKGWGAASDDLSKNFGVLLKFLLNIYKHILKGLCVIGGILNRKKLLVFVLSFGLILVSFVFWAIPTFNLADVIHVKAGQVAIDIKTGKQLGMGSHVVSPRFSNYIISHVAKYDMDITKITADSKEPQDVIVNVKVVFQLDKDKLMDFYSREGVLSISNVGDSIVTPRVIESIKKVIREYSYKDVLPMQNKIKEEAMVEIKKELEPLGVVLSDFHIINIILPQNYINKLQERELLAESISIEKSKLEEAQLQTETEKEIANRERDKKIIEAEGIAKANELINSQQITPAMIQLKQIERDLKMIDAWNGVLPTSVGNEFSLVE